MTLYISDTHLTGSKPRQITSSGKIAGLLKKGTIWYEVGQLPDGKWLYSTEEGYVPPVDPVEPPVTPPPPPPPPPVSTDALAAMASGESFIQTDALGVGFNAFAGIGTLKAAPDGFRTDIATGLKRLGLFVPPLNDIILQGRAIEGFAVVVGGKRYANMLLTGLSQIPGVFVGPLEWRGAVAGVEVVQQVYVEGKRVRVAATLTNRTAAPLNVQYLRAVDPDQSDKYNTTQTVKSPGVVECKLQGGGALIVRAEGASFAVQAYNKAAEIGTALTKARTADDVVQAVFPFVPLAPGRSVTHVVEYEVVTP